MSSHQPMNTLAPFKMQGSGDPIYAERISAKTVIVDTVVFLDGSTMQTASGGLPSFIDEGTF